MGGTSFTSAFLLRAVNDDPIKTRPSLEMVHMTAGQRQRSTFFYLFIYLIFVEAHPDHYEMITNFTNRRNDGRLSFSFFFWGGGGGCLDRVAQCSIWEWPDVFISLAARFLHFFLSTLWGPGGRCSPSLNGRNKKKKNEKKNWPMKCK